jgi:nicotinate-nucleotide pyrophosphorylase (carboxylating)
MTLPLAMTHLPQSKALDWDAPEITALVRAALDEDLGAGDLTALSLVPSGSKAKARILAKQDVVLAGLPLAARVFAAADRHVRWEPQFQEGAGAPAGGVVALLEGPTRGILTAERTALNFLAHLSGIATLTRRFVEAVAGTSARIRDTRKTTPLLRQLEKYAVRMGGGTNHRFGLYDAILIKENHIAMAGGVGEALRRAHTFTSALDREMAETTAYESFAPPPASPQARPVPIQIEVRNEAELREALAAGADAVLLDNCSPAEAARLTELARRERPGTIVEISGGLNLGNIRAYAETGADFLSIGALTHSAPAADFTLLVDSPSLK